MYYQENLRKARDYLTKRQKQIESLNRKPQHSQVTNIRQIFAIIRQRNDSDNRKLKTQREENCMPLMVITSQSPEPKDHCIPAKLLRLNKITRTEIAPASYNFLDKIIEPTTKRLETKSEQISPLRLRKNGTEKKYCIASQIGQKKLYHIQKTQNNIHLANSLASSPILRLNKTTYQNDKTKLEKPKSKEIQLIRRISGWTIQSQESGQGPF